ncbi:hypothetical protein EXIGLDRAFT_724238 [Exidia glandulosa HHB12029]|uniref:Uncharacterized protein n=1 Tax=Exidia glandulosa HHB12029 TaxID=1314781 RepID=A0A165MS09_EXIGL|nr:hypothetical protein EXIGLDRAFT_724238 [Exidia glandulosa HHB12029]
MVLLTRRLVRAVTHSPLSRLISTDRLQVHAVASLRANPEILPKIADRDEAKSHVQLMAAVVNELALNPSVSTRWDYISRLVARLPHREADVLALQPSHAEAIEKLAQAPAASEKFADLRGMVFRKMLRVRYPDAPFLALDNVLRIGEIVPPARAVGFWVIVLPELLVRLGTHWERKMFNVEDTRREAARQLRVVEEKHPGLTTPRQLMQAYAATRVAPDDVARQWAAVLASKEQILLTTAGNALAAAPDLDTLNRVRAQIQAHPAGVTPPQIPRAPNTMPMLDVLYAQHLVRLGAVPAAVELASKYDFHRELGWLLWNESTIDTDGPAYVAAKRNRIRVKELEKSGLDLEAILYILAPESPFRYAVRDASLLRLNNTAELRAARKSASTTGKSA